MRCLWVKCSDYAYSEPIMGKFECAVYVYSVLIRSIMVV